MCCEGKFYPDLDYFNRKKSYYVLDFCFTEIHNSIFWFHLQWSHMAKSLTIIYLSSQELFRLCQQEKTCHVSGVSIIIFHELLLGGVGHCFTWHVQVSLGFYSILKQKNLYIVCCVQCDIWSITAPKLIHYHEK